VSLWAWLNVHSFDLYNYLAPGTAIPLKIKLGRTVVCTQQWVLSVASMHVILFNQVLSSWRDILFYLFIYLFIGAVA
jgi:hypothetical protein